MSFCLDGGESKALANRQVPWDQLVLFQLQHHIIASDIERLGGSEHILSMAATAAMVADCHFCGFWRP